jgi:ADP-heptose:LPS heptosyltransferase
LLESNNVYWFSYQRDTDLLTPGEKRRFHIYDTSEDTRAFEDTAHYLIQMDLCITVCTAVAHLAGSLGIPTWLLLSKPGHYLWGQHQETTPWYPSMTIMRQETPGDWETLISKVKTKLQNMF